MAEMKFPYYKLPSFDTDSNGVDISQFVNLMKAVSLEGSKFNPEYPEDRVAVGAFLCKLRNVSTFAAILVIFEVDAKEAFSSCHSVEHFNCIEWIIDQAKKFVRQLFPHYKYL